MLSSLPDFSFLSVGDWGSAAVKSKDWYHDAVYSVAQGMSDAADTLDARFVLNTGDNFYWCGIQNTSDYQIDVDFVKPFLQHDGLTVPWYTTLGNHEYGYNVQAQIDLSDKITNWILPARYYSKRIKLGDSQWMTLLVVDTSPCIQEYRDDDKSGWDPCSDEFPTCSITNGKDDFEGKCMFHENILSQDCKSQKTAVQVLLDNVPDDDWLIISGHHMADEIDVEDMCSMFQDHGFDLYLNGHAHTLTHYSVDKDEIYVTTGAGGLVETDTQTSDATPHKRRVKLKANGVSELLYNGHTYNNIWNEKVAGFTSHTFNADFTKLTTNFVSYEGKKLHTFTVTKGDRHLRAARRKLQKDQPTKNVE